MADELFQKLFRRRQRRIQAADAAVAEATRLFGEAKTGDQQRLVRAAAKRCERAAALYREVGLGLLAKEQFAEAARYYSLAGDCDGARLNQERWSAVSTYWGEDGQA
ncbi:MAG: hypothetical protein ACKOSQ_08200 [Planctomycetaceae bacterium]